MTIELPFNVNDTVFYSNAEHIFNFGTIDQIEVEVFVKVSDGRTGDIKIMNPDEIFTKETAMAYLQDVQSQINTILPDSPVA